MPLGYSQQTRPRPLLTEEKHERSTADKAIPTTEHFRRQLENICRLERLSADERRKIDQAVIEHARQTHGRDAMPCLTKLENGGVLRMLIAFDEAAPRGRSILKILSARVVR